MKKYRSHIISFSLAFIIMILSFIPNIIIHKGFFIYAGDYDYQYIDFSAHVFSMVRNGMVSSDLFTALGSDFLLSYGHIIFTPFFSIILLMPNVNAVIASLPFIIALKSAVASLTAFLYIKRYVKNEGYAILGALLYAFSGFQTFNIIFGSFHDKTAFFPLMLLFLDELAEDNRKGKFAVIVAVMAAMDAFFFYGQAVFLIIYYIVKIATKTYKFSIKQFACLAIEACIGVILSAVLLYPGAMALSSNSRVSSFINGMDCLSYSDRSILFRIIQSVFMAADKNGVTSLFEGENTWTSISLYLPCVGAVFVFSYIKRNIRSWESVLLIVSAVFMLVPVLNSAFYMFNSAYYARWFYMPLLIMAMITVKEIEIFDKKSFLFGIKVSSIALLIFALIAFLPGKKEKNIDGQLVNTISLFGFAVEPIYFWRTLGIAGLFVIIIYEIMIKYYENKGFLKKIIVVISASVVVLNAVYFNDVYETHKTVSYLDDYYGLSITEHRINDEGYYRINGQQYNANLIWGIPAIDNFITVASPSLNDFYDAFDVYRVQTAYINPKYYPINGLFSCKYYYNLSTGDELNIEHYPFKSEGFEKYEIQPFYHIYKNKAFIPVGFSYDYYITESEIDKITQKYEGLSAQEENKSDKTDNQNALESKLNDITQSDESDFEEKYLQKMLVMLRAVVVSDEDESKISKILSPIPDSMLEGLGTETYYADCAERKASSCSEFNVTRTGFEARISADKQNYVYFSVPFMKSWSAEVNGEKAEILKVNYGFMAVKVDNGYNEIVFRYKNNDYRTGALISLIGLAMYIVYMIICKFADRTKSKAEVRVKESAVQEGN